MTLQAVMSFVARAGVTEMRRKKRGKTLLDLGFIQLASVLDALLKRDHENQSRQRNELLGKIKRGHSINDIS